LSIQHTEFFAELRKLSMAAEKLAAAADKAAARRAVAENFPELWNQKRATIMQIMDTPYGQQLTQEPENRS